MEKGKRYKLSYRFNDPLQMVCRASNIQRKKIISLKLHNGKTNSGKTNSPTTVQIIQHKQNVTPQNHIKNLYRAVGNFNNILRHIIQKRYEVKCKFQ